MPKHQYAIAIALPLLVSSIALGQSSYRGDGEGGYERNKPEWHQKMCVERYARKVGRLAYLEAKLGLNDQQRAAFAKWRQTRLDAADQRRSRCLQYTQKDDSSTTAVDRAARMEKRLTARLQEVQASRPALQALYDSLSAEQKVTFDRATSWHKHRWHSHEQGREQGREHGRMGRE